MSSYPILSFYGYRVLLPEDVDRVSYRADLYSLQPALPEPFRIINLLSTSSLDHIFTDKEYEELDESTTLWVGFVPTDLESTIRFHAELKEFLMDNILFDGITFEDKPAFHSGTEWITEEESEDEEDDEEEEEEEEDDDEEEEEDFEEDDEEEEDEEDFEDEEEDDKN
jgi:hypothetical protein